MGKTVRKKIEKQYFCAVKSGAKRFEIRKDDDGIDIGDILILDEYNDGMPTGRTLKRFVRYTLRDCPCYGLMPGYVIIGL